jgi:hypothetical protein
MVKLLLPLLILGQVPIPEQEPFKPPFDNRPESFRGALGLFRIKASASPTTVPVGQPIRYVLEITADENVKVLAPPTRPPLDQDPEFRRLFTIEAPEHAASHKGNSWEFFYLLKPRKEGSAEIPEFIFGFFNPKFGQDPKGYQEPSTAPIPIVVTPAQKPPPPIKDLPSASSYPGSVSSVADDDAILRRQERWTPPSLGWLVALLLAPPLGSLAWLVVWRRLYPDAARQAKLRRSRAAREALHALARARTAQVGPLAEQIAGIIGLYLDHRFGLHAAVPTPQEVDTFLRGTSIPDALSEQTISLLETCDALRFSNVPPAVSGSLADAAEQLILALEAQSWATPQS